MHPVETALVLLLVIGSFVVWGIVVVVLRRRGAEGEVAPDQPIEHGDT